MFVSHVFGLLLFQTLSISTSCFALDCTKSGITVMAAAMAGGGAGTGTTTETTGATAMGAMEETGIMAARGVS